MLFVCSHLEDIGYIRYDFLKKKDLSISIAIKEKYKRHGYGKLMLIKTLNKKNIINKNIYAFVKMKNFTSKNFFLKMGFVKKKDGTYLLKHK